MKVKDIISAKDAVARLASKSLTSYKKARAIAKLKKTLDEELEIYVREETKVVERYADKDEHGSPKILEGGRIQLKDVEAKLAFDKAVQELQDTDIEIDPVVLTEADFKTSEDIPTAADMLTLEGAVVFED